jgi:hypothetical protein
MPKGRKEEGVHVTSSSVELQKRPDTGWKKYRVSGRKREEEGDGYRNRALLQRPLSELDGYRSVCIDTGKHVTRGSRHHSHHD